jgi:hypothetical protein
LLHYSRDVLSITCNPKSVIKIGFQIVYENMILPTLPRNGHKHFGYFVYLNSDILSILTEPTMGEIILQFLLIEVLDVMVMDGI